MPLPSDRRERISRARLAVEGLCLGDAIGERFFDPGVIAHDLPMRQPPPGSWRYTHNAGRVGTPGTAPSWRRDTTRSWRISIGCTPSRWRSSAPRGHDDLRRRCKTPAGVPITVWKWLRAMVEHEVHHPGQIYLMLRMLGMGAPPLYGLTEEEVLERSSR